MELRSRFVVFFATAVIAATIVAALSIGLVAFREAEALAVRLEEDMLSALERQLRARSHGALSFFVATIRNSLYTNDFDAMNELARAALVARDLTGLRIYGGDGLTLIDGTGDMDRFGEPAPEALARMGPADAPLIWIEGDDVLAGQAVCAASVCFGFASIRIDGTIVEREREVLREHIAVTQSAQTHTIAVFGAVVTVALTFLAGLFGAVVGRGFTSGITAAIEAIQQIADGRSSVTLAQIGDPALKGLSEAVVGLSHRLERAQNYRAAVFSQFGDALFVASAAGEIVMTNAAFDAMFGDPGNGFVGRRIHELLPIEPDTTGESMIGALERIDALETPGLAAVPVAVACRALHSSAGAAPEVLGVVRDITEQARREAEMRSARTAAEAATIAKSQFLAVMSHELRTPLNGVLGGAELLASGGLDREQQRYVDIIQSSGSLLLDLISGILELSRIEAGEATLQLTEVDLDELAHDAMTLHVPRAHAEGLALRVSVAPRCARVRADRDNLRQILANLLGNAVKFTDRGSVALDVDCVVQDGQAMVTFEVCDTGMGIAEDKLESVFDSFVQVDSSATRKHEGTGLGLSITRSLVALMGGRITADSRFGIGTTFRCTLPLAVAEEAPAAGLRLKGSRILLVHADVAIARTLARQLSSEGAVTRLAHSAEQGVQCLSEARADGGGFDLVLASTRLLNDPAAGELRAHIDGRHGGLHAGVLAARYGADPTPAVAGIVLETIAVPSPHERVVAAVADLLAGRGSVAAVDGRTGAPEPAHPPATPRPDRLILIAEDNSSNLFLIESFVQRCGHAYAVAEDGVDAVRLYRECRPRIVLMDVSMPRQNGLEATRQIRAFEAAEGLDPALVIGLTANALDGDEKKCLEAGMSLYLPKPIDFRRLAGMLEPTPASLPEGRRAAV